MKKLIYAILLIVLVSCEKTNTNPEVCYLCNVDSSVIGDWAHYTVYRCMTPDSMEKLKFRSIPDSNQYGTYFYSHNIIYKCQEIK